MKNNYPIGIFDSGIGGLSVTKAISEHLPNERIIYFGDTAHMPYGDKSKELIHRYVTQIVDFLINKYNCKMIIIACNTASATSYEFIRDNYSIPIINVIDPIIEQIAKENSIHKCGLIATNSTVKSGIYTEKMNRRNPQIELVQLATPLLAPMIEEYFFEEGVKEKIIHNYLYNNIFDDIDSLILGCTHYVLIKKEIDDFFKGNVKLFESGDYLPKKVKSILENENLINNSDAHKKNKFYASNITVNFQNIVKLFYNEDVEFEEIKLGE